MVEMVIKMTCRQVANFGHRALVLTDLPKSGGIHQYYYPSQAPTALEHRRLGICLPTCPYSKTPHHFLIIAFIVGETNKKTPIFFPSSKLWDLN